MGTVLTAVIVSENFFTIDRLLQAQANPTFVLNIEKLGHDSTRALLYYFSSELNRLYFQGWNLAQLAIGIIALWLVVKLPVADKAKWGIVAMLGVVLFLTGLITPRMITLGRELDFVPRDPTPDGLRTFGLLHATYTVFDGILLVLGILVTLWLVRSNEAVSARRPSVHESDESRQRGSQPRPA